MKKAFNHRQDCSCNFCVRVDERRARKAEASPRPPQTEEPKLKHSDKGKKKPAKKYKSKVKKIKVKAYRDPFEILPGGLLIQAHDIGPMSEMVDTFFATMETMRIRMLRSEFLSKWLEHLAAMAPDGEPKEMIVLEFTHDINELIQNLLNIKKEG